MIEPIAKWILKLGISFLVWVFILSIHWNGRTLFSHAHEHIVKSDIVQSLDQEIAQAWDRAKTATRDQLQDKPTEDDQTW